MEKLRKYKDTIMLVLLAILVSTSAYLLFSKQDKHTTEFVNPSTSRDSVMLLDYAIEIHQYNDSVIKYNYEKQITNSDSSNIDSVWNRILRAIR